MSKAYKCSNTSKMYKTWFSHFLAVSHTNIHMSEGTFCRFEAHIYVLYRTWKVRKPRKAYKRRTTTKPVSKFPNRLDRQPLESWHFGFRRKRGFIICVAKANAQISCTAYPHLYLRICETQLYSWRIAYSHWNVDVYLRRLYMYIIVFTSILNWVLFHIHWKRRETCNFNMFVLLTYSPF